MDELKEYILLLLKEKKLTIAELSSVVDSVISSYSQSYFPNVEVGWYAFANSRFSVDKNAYPDLLGVVAWVNPDKNALKGNRGLILLKDRICSEWVAKRCLTNISDIDNGEENTEKCRLFSQENAVSFPGVDWCEQYSETMKVQAFVPSIAQLLKVAKNTTIINSALRKIKAPTLQGWVFSSTEHNKGRQKSVLFPEGCEGYCCKADKKVFINFVMAF